MYLLFRVESFGPRIKLFSFRHENQFTSFCMFLQSFTIELTSTSLRTWNKIGLIQRNISRLLNLFLFDWLLNNFSNRLLTISHKIVIIGSVFTHILIFHSFYLLFFNLILNNRSHLLYGLVLRLLHNHYSLLQRFCHWFRSNLLLHYLWGIVENQFEIILSSIQWKFLGRVKIVQSARRLHIWIF